MSHAFGIEILGADVLNIGDHVISTHPNHNPKDVGEVVRFAPDGSVSIQYLNGGTVAYPKDLVKVGKEIPLTTITIKPLTPAKEKDGILQYGVIGIPVFVFEKALDKINPPKRGDMFGNGITAGFLGLGTWLVGIGYVGYRLLRKSK